MFKGLLVTTFMRHKIGAHDRIAYRVWAEFTNRNDHLIECFGPLSVESFDANGQSPGRNFFNPVASNTSPTHVQIHGGIDANGNPMTPVANAQFETYVTIGVHNADQGSGPEGKKDETRTSPAFPSFINGNSILANEIRWYTDGPVEQGRAGRYFENKVLIMQLTVYATDGVRGRLSLRGIDADNGNEPFSAENVTFEEFDGGDDAASSAMFGQIVALASHEKTSMGIRELKSVIARGEGDGVEFKETARWDVKIGEQKDYIEEAIVKTVAAFSNCRGGVLLIGVADDGQIHGLSRDYGTLKEHPSQDGFQQWLVQRLSSAVGQDIAASLRVSIVQFSSSEVCRVDVQTVRPTRVCGQRSQRKVLRTNRQYVCRT